MKVLHCCLAAFYIDNYGYQENILPRMHKIQGHNVMILASTETYVDNLNLGYVEPKSYINEDGIPVIRIPYSRRVPSKMVHKLRIYDGIYDVLNSFGPDFIFMHDAQFLSIGDVIKYLKEHPHVRLNIDSHTDSNNSAKGFLSKRILHGIIYKHCLKRIEPYVNKFLGTLPNRVDFFIQQYGMPKKKVKLLVMGADDKAVQRAKDSGQRDLIRHRYNIADDEILIVSGGKFNGEKKSILNVMEAVKYLSSSVKIKLLIYGSVSEENGFGEKFRSICDGKHIIYVGWIKSSESYNYFEASDIIIFPGLHSVLWEQAVGQGKPCIFRHIPGQTHIDLGGNCKFLYKISTEEISKVIKMVISDYDHMSKVAIEKGLITFSYYEIAKRALE